MNIINLNPASRMNNRMFLNKLQEEVYLKNNVFFKNQYYSHKLCSVTNEKLTKPFSDDFSFVHKSLVYLITESVAEYPYPFLSEKTWKAILYQTPFMVVGGKHSLRLLQSFGFQTFGDFWNEDYDNCEYAAERIDKIIDNLKILNDTSKDKLDNMYQNMLPILEHNRNHLENFYYSQVEEFKEKLKDL